MEGQVVHDRLNEVATWIKDEYRRKTGKTGRSIRVNATFGNVERSVKTCTGY